MAPQLCTMATGRSAWLGHQAPLPKSEHPGRDGVQTTEHSVIGQGFHFASIFWSSTSKGRAIHQQGLPWLFSAPATQAHVRGSFTAHSAQSVPGLSMELLILAPPPSDLSIAQDKHTTCPPSSPSGIRYSGCRAWFLVLDFDFDSDSNSNSGAARGLRHAAETRANDTRRGRPHRSPRDATGTPFWPIGSTWLPGGSYGTDTSVDSIGSTWLGCLMLTLD